MKGFITKIISILVIAMMIINSSLLTIISVAIDEVEKIIDESKIDANYELNIRKYVNYEVGEERGLMVQTYLKDGIEYQEGQEQVPIKATNVVINAPKVNGEYPQKVEVIVDSTKLTNGDDNGKDVNYSYNNENGELTIITENKADEKGNVYSEYSTEDKNEYKLNFYYSSNCYDAESVKRTLEFTGKVQFKLSKDEGIVVNKDISQSFEVSENISGLISTEVTTSDIYNGYIESNKDNDTKYRTEYTEKVGIDIDYKDIFDEISISENDKFVKNDKEIETEDIVYKGIKINKNDVLSKLGEDGTLKITNENGEILAEINKDTEAKEDGTVEVTYQNEAKNIKVDISKPVSLGRIEIENTKEIKETMKDIDVTNIKTESNISCINNVTETTKAVDEETKEEKDVETVKTKEIYNYVSTNLVEIKASKTEVKVSANNVNWTNNVQNDVTFTTTLVTNGAEYSLFKNPVINIKLPQEIEKVLLGNVSLLYDDNLKIKSANIEEIDGCKVIKIEIDGTQKSYTLNSMTDGVNVIIPTIVIAKKDINTVNTSVEFNCYNSNNTNINGNIDVNINSISENTNEKIVKVQNANNNQVIGNAIKASDISITSTAQVGNQVLNSGDTVYERQVIKYTVKIKNNSDKIISGIKVLGKVPDGTVYATINRGNYYDEKYDYVKDEKVKEYTFNNVNTLNPGEEKEESYEVVVDDLGNDETEKEIKNQIQTIVNDKTYQNDELTNVIKQAELRVDLKSYIGRNTENSFYYDLFIENLTDHEINNVVVTTSEFQKEMTYDIGNLSIDKYHEISNMSFENRILKFNVDSIEPGGIANVKFNLIVENFDENINECIIKMVAKAQVEDGIMYESNENIRTAYPQYVTVTKSSNKEGEVLSYGDEIEYEINVKNESKVRTYVSIRDYLPKELNGISAEYEEYIIMGDENPLTVYDIEAEKNLNCIMNKITIDLSYKVVDKADIDIAVMIPAGKTFTIKIKAKASYVSQRTEISNSAIVFGEYIKTTTSNIVKSYIVPVDYKEEPDNPNPDNPNPDNPNPDNPNPDNPNPDNPKPDGTNKKYGVNGLVWVDSNKNGQRDNGENLLSGVTVKLYNADTNSIVKDENGNNKITTTGENGQYSFTGLVSGNYLVLFEYNTLEYNLTSYKASGVSEKDNSDVVLKNVSIDGQEKNVGLTDVLKIVNSNIENINMGLVEKEKFDLALNKSITNIVLKYGNEEHEYKYSESKLVKVEVPAKKISGATIKVEYQLEVKNEGNIDGYVDEIIDYLPEDFIFETDNNSGWSKKGTGTLVNNSLSGIIIKPGESKKVKLYLTRNITSDKLGILTNTAEIQKSNSINGSNDIDSTNGNKSESEDDYSQAQLIISVKTGIFRNITIFIIVFIALIIMIYLIKTKRTKIFMIITFTMIISAGSMFNQVLGFNVWLHEYKEGGGSTFDSDYEYEEYRDKFVCADPGHHQCSEHGHTYTGYTNSVVSTTTGPYTNKNVNFEKVNAENITASLTSDEWNFVGPYVVSSNCGGNVLVNAQFMTNSGTVVSMENSNNNEYVRLVDGNGNDIGNWTILDNSQYGFYLKIRRDITKVNFVKVGNTVENVTYTVTSGTQIDYYYCSSVSGKHNRECIASDGKGDHNMNGTKNACQRMTLSSPYYREDYSPATVSVEFGPVELTGELTINKKDADTGESLNGVTFNLTGPNDYNQNFTVNGSYTISNLPFGNYTITEIGTPNKYNIDLQDDKEKKVTVPAGGTVTADYTNKQYGNLKISKQDLNTGSNNLDGIKLKDIQFKIYIIENGQKKYLSNVFPTKYSYSDFNVWENNKANAKTFTTDANAEFVVYNLPVYNGGNKITYYIEEYALPDSLQPYYEVKATADAINLSNGETPTLTVKNQQLYIDISGYVWEDRVNSSKVNTRDNLYVQPEPLISGITVRLKNKNNGSVIATQTTNSKGAYKFSKVKISELKNYIIEFEYNGLKYGSVTANLNQANGSKAVEKTTDRTNFNNSFASITGGNAKGNSTTGYSRNQKGTVTNRLTYKNGTYSSTLVQNTKYTTGSANGIVTAQNGSTGVRIYADTNTAGMALIWSAGVKEISNINLGIAERAQADLSIATDLSTIDMAFNGYSHTYNYDRRIKASGIDIFSELQKWNKTDAQKNNESSNYPRSYTRSVYKNYVYASGVDGEGSLSEQNKLQINLTYKIQIKNESSLYMSANEIANYFDNTLDYVSSYYIDSKGNKVNVAWTSKSDKNGYKQLRTTGVKDLKIQPGSSVTIYVTMKKNTIPQWKNKNSLKESTYNVTEITSYSSYTKNGNNYSYYAAIDKDSAPDNINVGTLNTYEDDTDMAPVVEFTFDEPRTISGYVFEDSTSNNLKTNAERKGDGKYNASNDGYVGNVKVELITKSNDQTAYIYPKAVTTANFNADKAVYTTTKDGKGYYEFVGIIPNEYYIKFTYGDGTVVYKKSEESVNGTTQDYKSTIITSEQMKNAYGGTEFNVSKNPRWYQDKNIKGYSTAVDDYATRKNINKALSTITYGISAGYDKKNSDTANLQTITARTPDMNIAIENVDKETTNLDENRTRLYDNIDFGIVERPRQSLNVTKEINYIKLTLATGSVLLEGNPQTDSLPYVTYPQRGILKIEADSEITQGATLEVGYILNVKNNSELDYDSEVYYKYGTKSSNDKAVNLTINSLVDYMDDELKTTYTADGNESGVWKLKTSTDIKNLIADNVYSTVKNKRNILVNNWSVTLKPTENKNVTATASKILSAEDEMAFANYVEILSYSNSVGRFYGEEKDGKWAHMTPGNYVYGAVASVHEGDDNAYDNANRAKISIVPSTGDNNIIYYVVGISSLVVVAGGVILIRKFVL